TLSEWTCCPAAIAEVARPIGKPYLTTASPAAIGASATLCPRATGSTKVTPAATSPAAASASRVATLSSAWIRTASAIMSRRLGNRWHTGPRSRCGARLAPRAPRRYAVEMEKTGQPTINDVARVAGVSKKTVSRVINRSPLLNDDTRKRVEDVIGQ